MGGKQPLVRSYPKPEVGSCAPGDCRRRPAHPSGTCCRSGNFQLVGPARQWSCQLRSARLQLEVHYGSVMDEGDVALRNLTYRLFVELGRAPTAADVAVAVGSSAAVVHTGWERLHDAHALVLQSGLTELRMANPFSAVPTAYRVLARDRWWYANCAWDAFGVCAALHVDGRIETSCADCGESIAIDVQDQQPDDQSVLFHCLVPATHWWDDIVFT